MSKWKQTAATYPIEFYPGNNVTLAFQITTPVTANNITTNVPVNITGYQFEANLLVNGQVFTGNVSVISAANGTIAPAFSRELTANVPEDCHGWELDMTDAANYKRTILAGPAIAKCKGGCNA
jgi:hypothetical protein